MIAYDVVFTGDPPPLTFDIISEFDELIATPPVAVLLIEDGTEGGSSIQSLSFSRSGMVTLVMEFERSCLLCTVLAGVLTVCPTALYVILCVRRTSLPASKMVPPPKVSSVGLWTKLPIGTLFHCLASH